MKKIICLFSFVFISLISCSHDDDQQAVINLNPDTALLRKTVSRNYSLNGGAAVTTLWNYNETKLSYTIDSNGLRTEYTYTGNLITQVDEISNGATRSAFFEYNTDHQLVAISGSRTETFTYNADGTVTDKLYYPDHTLQWTATVYFSNGEISRIEKGYANSLSTVHEYAYDDKHSPTSNILGFDKISLTPNHPHGCFRNVISGSYTDSEGVDGQVNKTWTYNAIGFPTTAHSTDDHLIDSYDTQFFYE